MRINQASRLAIIGNSGSGKSTLARAIGGQFKLPVHHLDSIHWEALGVQRDDEAATRMVRGIAATDAWIVEGVFGWLVEAALPSATDLVWIDLSWEDCRDGLERRGPVQEGSSSAFDELLSWANGYWVRTTSSSYAGHSSLYESFQASKLRISTRLELTAFRKRQLTGDEEEVAGVS